MGIVGGALIPLAVGALADRTSLATSLIVPALCYLLIAVYGWSARKPA
jgi:MFS transporter, FHS family, L-fucose permease